MGDASGLMNRWRRRPRRLRAGVAQALFVVAGIAGGVVVGRLRTPPTVPANQVFQVLMTVGFGVLSISALVFSLLFLVVQWAATTLTPRLNLFRDDPIVWRTFGYIVGVFVFCLTAALEIGRDQAVSVAVPLIAILLVIIAIELIRRLQAKAFRSIQLAPTLAAVTSRGLAGLPGTVVSPPVPVLADPVQTVTWSGPSAVVQGLKTQRLLTLAGSGDAIIVVRAQAGQAMLTGSPIADVHAAAPVDPEAVLAALRTGPERIFGQDSLLAFRLLADIAVRALSPAVNDPATAVQTLDRLHELFLPITGRPLGDLVLAADDGSVRVIVTRPTWEAYLRTGLDDVLACLGGWPLVIDRLRALLDDLAARATPEQRGALGVRQAILDAADPGAEHHRRL